MDLTPAVMRLRIHAFMGLILVLACRSAESVKPLIPNDNHLAAKIVRCDENWNERETQPFSRENAAKATAYGHQNWYLLTERQDPAVSDFDRFVQVMADYKIPGLSWTSDAIDKLELDKLKKLPALRCLRFPRLADRVETINAWNIASMGTFRSLEMYEGPAPVELAARLAQLPRLSMVILTGQVSAEALQELRRAPQIEFLKMYDTRLSEQNIRALTRWPALRKVWVTYSEDPALLKKLREKVIVDNSMGFQL